MSAKYEPDLSKRAPKVYESTVVKAPIEEVWRYIRDFDSLPEWHPDMNESELKEGEGETGSVRELALEGGGTVVEKLLELSDLEHKSTYTVLETPLPMKNYVSTIKLSEVTDSGETFAEWYAFFDVTDSSQEEETVKAIRGVYKSGLKGLAETLE